MKTNKLLQKVKDNQKQRKIRKVPAITEESYEVGVAWAKGEIRTEDIKIAMELEHHSNVYSFLSMCFKYHFQNKKK